MADSTPSAPSTPAASAPATPAAQPSSTAVDTKAAPAKAVTPPAVPDDVWEVKIDGKPVKKSKKEILEAYQLRELSDKKRSEADKTLAEYNKLFQTFKTDPIKFMKATGVDFDTLSTQYLAKKAEESMMDPKERELRQARQEAETYKKWVEEQKASQEKATQDREIAVARESIHKEIITEIEAAKDLGLPVDEELVIHIANKMILQDKKQKPLNAKEAISKAYESQQKYLKSMASKMSGEALMNWLGQEVANKIRKYDLEQLKKKRTPAAPQARVETKVDTSKPAPKYKTWSQFKAEKLDTIK